MGTLQFVDPISNAAENLIGYPFWRAPFFKEQFKIKIMVPFTKFDFTNTLLITLLDHWFMEIK